MLNPPHSLLEISRLVLQAKDLTKQLQFIASFAQELLCAQAVALYLFDETKRFLTPAFQDGAAFKGAVELIKSVPVSAGNKAHQPDPFAYCAITGKLVFVPDAYTYTGFNLSVWHQLDQISHYRTESLHFIPLIDGHQQSVGVMALVNRNEKRLENNRDISDPAKQIPPEDTKLIQGFAALAAIAISNSLLHEQNQTLLKQQFSQQPVESPCTPSRESHGAVVGESTAMQDVFGLIDKVATSAANVFIHGETGTGKELIAETIHRNSLVKNGQFIAQNCAAFPPDLLESEMFGYKKGAFSGATKDKKGLFEVAHNGTLFLDEIGEMPMSLQAKLLRVLQEGEIRPVGGLKTVSVDVRVVAATNRDLKQLISDGLFREDLYYRLNVFPISLPPLRERREDIPMLMEHFSHKFALQYNKDIQQVEPALQAFCQTYDFPGNVRELQNIVERLVIMSDGQGALSYQHLPADLKLTDSLPGNDMQALPDDLTLKQAVEVFEAQFIKRQLGKNGGNQTHTAQQLGLSRRTLVEKLGKYNLRRMDTNPY